MRGPLPGADLLAGLAPGPRPVPPDCSSWPVAARPPRVFAVEPRTRVFGLGPGPGLGPAPIPFHCSTAIPSEAANVPCWRPSCQLSAAPANMCSISAEHVGSVPAWPRNQPHSHLSDPSASCCLAPRSSRRGPASAPEHFALCSLPSSLRPLPSTWHELPRILLLPRELARAKVQAGLICGSR